MFQRAAFRRGFAISLVSAYTLVLALALPSGVAQAHAAYVSSTPAANSVLTSAPTTVTITFAQQLDPKGLSITVYGNKGDVVSTGTAQISSSDPKTASVTMKGDGSDIYRVDWTTVSAQDGDPTLGAFVFGVDPSGKTDKVPSPAGTTTVTQTTGTPSWVAILAGIGGLVIGFAAAYFLRNQRATAGE